jgi:RNA-directed DNA polymerase
MSEPKPNGKPFAISKRLVWEAWLRVKANKGAEGVDEESIQAFEENLRDNLSSSGMCAANAERR